MISSSLFPISDQIIISKLFIGSAYADFKEENKSKAIELCIEETGQSSEICESSLSEILKELNAQSETIEANQDLLDTTNLKDFETIKKIISLSIILFSTLWLANNRPYKTLATWSSAIGGIVSILMFIHPLIEYENDLTKLKETSEKDLLENKNSIEKTQDIQVKFLEKQI